MLKKSILVAIFVLFGVVTGGVIGSALIGGGAALATNLFNRRHRDREVKRLEGREDTAVQRRAADLEAAGLSKTLAAGGAADSHKVSPHESDNPIESAMQAAALSQVKADVSKTNAEIDSINLQNDHRREMNVMEQKSLSMLNEHNSMHYKQIRSMAYKQIEELEAKLPHISGMYRTNVEKQIKELRQMERNLEYANRHQLPIGVALNNQNMLMHLFNAGVNALDRIGNRQPMMPFGLDLSPGNRSLPSFNNLFQGFRNPLERDVEPGYFLNEDGKRRGGRL